jgi:hypothetical protein
METMEYPKFLYHATEAPRIVGSVDEEKALGHGWANSPAEHGVITCPSTEQMAASAEEDDAANHAAKDEMQEVADAANAAPKRRGRPRGQQNVTEE